jgi:hypothetical protein
VKARSVSFYAEPNQIPELERRIQDEVLPRFAELPGFLGFVALRSDGTRPEIIAMTFWSGDLEDSESVSEEFRDEVDRVMGTTPSRKEFDVMNMMIRGPDGETDLDLP